MGIFALILGVLGGSCGVMGILTAVEVAPTIHTEFTWLFWFWLAGILFLASIVTLLTRGPVD